MSAPAGWHLQPDGQERFWDGTAWTDQFRAPLPNDPTAPPPQPAWAASVDETQALDVDHTQAIPAAGRHRSSRPSRATTRRYPRQTDQGYAYPQPGYPQQGYPQAGLPAPDRRATRQTGYGAPGSQPYAPPPRQGSGMAKGCLIAASLGRAPARRRRGRAASTSSTGPPTRSARPSRRASPPTLPTDLPLRRCPPRAWARRSTSPSATASTCRAATIQPGWRLRGPGRRRRMVQITGMKAALTSDGGFPVLFTMSFPDAAGARGRDGVHGPVGSRGRHGRRLLRAAVRGRRPTPPGRPSPPRSERGAGGLLPSPGPRARRRAGRCAGPRTRPRG